MMPIQNLYRIASILVFAALVSGCFSTNRVSSNRVSECGWWGNCSYEGSYEAGEEAFAEREAARLNRAQSVKMRSSYRRF